MASGEYTPGTDSPSDDEPIRTAHRSLLAFWPRRCISGCACSGYEWITAGMHKLQDPAWVSTGTALRRTGSAPSMCPRRSARITYPAYRAFIQFVLDNQWSRVLEAIAWGELLIGLHSAGWSDRHRRVLRPADEFLVPVRWLTVPIGCSSCWSHAAVWLAVARLVGTDHYLLPRVSTPWSRGPRRSQARRHR
jgi:thiosulfate dehydrogenase [quinone] large subunit